VAAVAQVHGLWSVISPTPHTLFGKFMAVAVLAAVAVATSAVLHQLVNQLLIPSQSVLAVVVALTVIAQVLTVHRVVTHLHLA
jgi:hypothetical protein